MEPTTRKRLFQKARNIYYSLRNFLCFFVTADSDDIDIGSGSSSTSAGSAKTYSLPLGWKSNSFPFECLPVDCQLHVFSYLSVVERGHACRVCRRWNELLHSNMFWSDVDLTGFLLCCRCPQRASTDPCTSITCYELYKERIQAYVERVKNIRPHLRRLRFAFDIGDYSDDWQDLLYGLLRTLRCSTLSSAYLNWKETPAKSPIIVEGALLSWSASTFNDFTSYHRRRQRLFASFFEFFCTSAVNVVDLSLPFDWSPRSLQALRHLQRLESLKLEPYFVPQPVDQAALDDLLGSLPSLRRLSLSVCISSGAGLVQYHISSLSLECLDLGHCRGFYLGQVTLPKLKSLIAAVQPSHGPLGAVTSHRPCVLPVPCLYEILCCGAPALAHLNGHKLEPNWQTDYVEDLHAVLQNICACPSHVGP